MQPICIQFCVLTFLFFSFSFNFCSCNALFFVLPPLPARKRLTLPIQCLKKTTKHTKEILEKLDDGVFVRTLQCLAAQQQKNQQHSSVGQGKEPSLMPVPSPQQISYLNQFEGNNGFIT